MPDFRTAAEILDAVDVLCEIAGDRWPDVVDGMRAAIHAEAAQQLAEDTAIGRAFAEDTAIARAFEATAGIAFGFDGTVKLGGRIRAAVVHAGGRITFPPPRTSTGTENASESQGELQ